MFLLRKISPIYVHPRDVKDFFDTVYAVGCFIITLFSLMTLGIWESLTTPIIITVIFLGIFGGHPHCRLALPHIYPWNWKEEILKCLKFTNNCSTGTYEHFSLCFVIQGSRFRSWFRPKDYSLRNILEFYAKIS